MAQRDTVRGMAEEAQNFVGEIKRFKVGKGFQFFSDLVKDIPIVNVLFSNLTQAANKFDDTLAATGNTFKALIAGALEFGKAVLKGLATFIISNAIAGIKLLSQASVDLSRNMVQVGKTSSQAFASMNAGASATGTTLAKNIPLMGQFNDSLGTSAVLTRENSIATSMLVNKLGLSAENAAHLFKETAGTGKNVGELVRQIADSTVEFNKAEGAVIGIKTIITDVADASAAVSLSAKNFPGGIQQAALQARKLGLSLDKVQSTMDGMLDIEESISKEMEAEILLGRDLNLDKARLAALNNDIEGFSQAIADQGITAAQFTKMNRLEQEALAGALGMGRDELAGMLKTQGALNQASEDAAKMGQEQPKSGQAVIDKLQKQVSLGESFEKAMESIQMAFGSLIADYAPDIISFMGKIPGYLEEAKGYLEDPIKPIFSDIKDFIMGEGGIVPGVENWKVILGAVALIKFSNIIGLVGTVNLLKGAFNGIKSAVNTVGSAFSKTFGSKGTLAKAFKPDSALMKGLGNISSKIGGLLKSVGKGGKNILGKLGNFVSSGVSAVKGVIDKVNPLNTIKESIKKAGGISKILGKFLKVGPVAAALEGAFAYNDIQSILATGASGKELNSAIGARAYEAIGSVLGAIGGSALGSVFPGAGTLIGGIAGSLGGPYLAKGIAQLFDSDYSKLGSVVAKAPFFKQNQAEDFISRPGQGITRFRKDDIIIGGTALGGDGNNNSRVEELLERLIGAVESGGDVFIDGNKVGNSLVLAQSRIN